MKFFGIVVVLLLALASPALANEEPNKKQTPRKKPWRAFSSLDHMASAFASNQ